MIHREREKKRVGAEGDLKESRRETKSGRKGRKGVGVGSEWGAER